MKTLLPPTTPEPTKTPIVTRFTLEGDFVVAAKDGVELFRCSAEELVVGEGTPKFDRDLISKLYIALQSWAERQDVVQGGSMESKENIPIVAEPEIEGTLPTVAKVEQTFEEQSQWWRDVVHKALDNMFEANQHLTTATNHMWLLPHRAEELHAIRMQMKTLTLALEGVYRRPAASDSLHTPDLSNK